MKAAIHLGPNYLANLEVNKKTNFEEIEILFNITQKLILEHSEGILDVKPLESTSPSWTRQVLSHDHVDKSKSTCLLTCSRSNNKMGRSSYSRCILLKKELLGTDGEAIEFEWTIFPGFSSLQILQEIQRD